jgi:polyisoprenoid-binding protein YceI
VETAAVETANVTEAPEATQPSIPETGGEAPTQAAATESVSDPGAVGSGLVTYRIVPEESTVSYAVGETFLNQNNAFNTAIGTTDGISGTIQVDFADPQNSSVSPLTVDISRFQSDSSRRDGALRDRFLESARFPTVTFVTKEIEGLPETIEPGQDYNLRLTGDLTIRDVTLPGTFDITARLEGEELRGQAETTFLMSQFGFGPISILGMLNTEDEVVITVEFVARPE